jgi:hypothetical protein
MSAEPILLRPPMTRITAANVDGARLRGKIDAV